MTTTSYCTRCGALVIRDELGIWTSLETYAARFNASVRETVTSEVCGGTMEFHRPEADEPYRGPRDFLAEEAARCDDCHWPRDEDREAADDHHPDCLYHP